MHSKPIPSLPAWLLPALVLGLSPLSGMRAAAPLAEASATAEEKPRATAPAAPKLPMAAALKQAAAADFEATFLALMIHQHMMGARLWSLAHERATDDTIRTMENRTTKKQKIEVEQMTAWLKKYHGKSPGDIPPPNGSTDALEADLEVLQKAGPADFNARFAQRMTRHLLEAIAMSRLAVQKVTHPEVKDLARNIANMQTKDHKRLQGIAKAAK